MWGGRPGKQLCPFGHRVVVLPSQHVSMCRDCESGARAVARGHRMAIRHYLACLLVVQVELLRVPQLRRQQESGHDNADERVVRRYPSEVLADVAAWVIP